MGRRECLLLDLPAEAQNEMRVAATAAGMEIIDAHSTADAQVVLDRGEPLCLLATSMRGLRALRAATTAVPRYTLVIRRSRQAPLRIRRGIDGVLSPPWTAAEVALHVGMALRIDTLADELGAQEEAARAALEFAENVINTVQEPFVVLDRALRVRTANGSFYRLLGLDATVVTGRPLPMVGHGQWSDPLLLSLLEGMFEGEPAFNRFEFQLEHLTIEVSANMITNAGRWLLMSLQDVTAERLVLRTLRASEELYRNQVEGVSRHTILMLDVDGRVVSASPGGLPLLGLSSRILNAAVIGVMQADLDQAAVTGTFIKEGWHVRPDGSRLYVETTISAIEHDGRLSRFVLVLQDATERYVQMRALSVAYDKERRISTALERSLFRDLEREPFSGFQIESLYEPALEEARVGGDFYDAFRVGPAVALVVGDASGKGLAAAQRTIEVRYSLRAFLLEDPSPASAVLRVNHLLFKQFNDPDAFVAVVVTVLWPDGRMSSTAAGMEGPLIVGHKTRLWPASQSGLPLGVLQETEYQCVSDTLSMGEILALFTDGLTDIRRKGVLLGAKGLSRLVGQAAGHPDLRSLGRQVFDEAQHYGPIVDDACMLLVRRLGPDDGLVAM